MTKTSKHLLNPEAMSPPKPPTNPNTVRVYVYVSEVEKQALLEQAGVLSLSEYLRRAGLGKRSLSPPAPEINRQTYLALAEISESLQQVAIALSQSPQPALDVTCLDTLQEEISQVRWQLLAPDAEAP